MFRRNLFYLAVLGGAVGIPYVATEYKRIGQAFTSAPATVDTQAHAPPTPGGVPASSAVSPGSPESTPAPLPPVAASPPVLTDTMMPLPDGPPIVDIAEALRFDVTPAWVLGRWPRVTACLPELNLQGYRVPLVSGTMDDDVAGSLSYYFNNRQQCVRITLQASTGDARKLVVLTTRRFGLVPQTSTDPGLYLYQLRWNGQAISELHVRPAKIIRATSPNSRFEVLLALNNPAAK